MTLPTGEPRDLQYPLDRSLVPVTQTPDEAIDNFPFTWPTTDSDEKVVVTIELSLNEFTAISSSLDVGSDIAYGSDAIFVWWLWVRSLNTMAICSQIIDCIENDPAVGTAINNYLLESGVINPDQINPDIPVMNDRFPPAERDTDVHAEPPACDKDAQWAGVFEIVSRLDEYGRDFLETVVAQADAVERAASIIALVPLIGDVIGETILELAEIAPDLLNAYNAYSSTTELENIACDLFETVCNDCKYPTYQEVYDYYASFGISGIQDIATLAYQAMVDYLIGSNGLANKVIYFTVIILQLFTLYLGGTFLNFRGKKWIGIWADIGEDNPNNGWELLCDGCGAGWCYSVDVTQFVNFDISSDAGNQYCGVLNGNQWDATDTQTTGGGNVKGIGVTWSFGQDVDVDDYEVDYNAVQGLAQGTTIAMSIQFFYQGSLVYWSYNTNPSPPFGSGQVLAGEAAVTADQMRIYQIVSNTNSTPTGSGSWLAARLYGGGTNPFGSDNC